METEDLKSYVVPALVGVGVLGALYYFTRGEGEVASLPILGGMAKSKALQLTDEQVVQTGGSVEVGPGVSPGAVALVKTYLGQITGGRARLEYVGLESIEDALTKSYILDLGQFKQNLLKIPSSTPRLSAVDIIKAGDRGPVGSAGVYLADIQPSDIVFKVRFVSDRPEGGTATGDINLVVREADVVFAGSLRSLKDIIGLTKNILGNSGQTEELKKFTEAVRRGDLGEVSKSNPTSSIVPVLQFAAGVGVLLWASSLLDTRSR